MACRAVRTRGSFSEESLIFSSSAWSMMLKNRFSGSKVVCLLSWSSFRIRSGHRDKALGPANSFPGTWINLRS